MAVTDHKARRARWLTNPPTLAFTGVSDNVQLVVGELYYLCADKALHWLQGDSSVEATAVSHYLPEGGIVMIEVTAAGVDDYVALIAHSDDGTAYFDHPEA